MNDKYQNLGASADKAGLHEALNRSGLSAPDNLFAQVTSDLAGCDEFYSFLHCDGAGTKSIIAHLMYRLTGDPRCYGGLAQDALVMNLDDVFCLGVPSSLTLANLIARNTRLVDDRALQAIFLNYKNLSLMLNGLGIKIHMCGGETADCGDIVRTLVVDAVLSGRILKNQVVNNSNIAAGDVIIGLSSTGQANYESYPNSGISSNGMTLARHSLLARNKVEDILDVVDPGLDPKLTYTGPFSLADHPAELGMTIGEALLSPTRTYAPILLKIYGELGNTVHGAIHCTGGGQTKILRFGKNVHYVKNNLFPVPPLFRLIQEHGEVSWHEMYKVFNMGHRFELYLPEKHADQVIAIAKQFQVDAQEIGYVKNSSSKSVPNQLTIESAYGIFEYSY